jgi:hypothetical protein
VAPVRFSHDFGVWDVTRSLDGNEVGLKTYLLGSTENSLSIPVGKDKIIGAVDHHQWRLIDTGNVICVVVSCITFAIFRVIERTR